jgi:ATP-binding cassette subfamily F protein 3
MAGSLLFSGDDIHKKVKVLSGGEKSRVAIGQLLLQRSPLLLLDEPTNHLDFDTVEALTEALRDYAGTIVVVSHDRGFIGRIASQILEIRDGRVEHYPGTYDEYVWSLQNGALKERFQTARSPEPSAKTISARTPQVGTKANFKDTSKHHQAQIRECERNIGKIEARLLKLTENRDRLNEKLSGAPALEAAALATELGECAQEIENLENDLLAQMEALEHQRTELERLRG